MYETKMTMETATEPPAYPPPYQPQQQQPPEQYPQQQLQMQPYAASPSSPPLQQIAPSQIVQTQQAPTPHQPQAVYILQSQVAGPQMMGPRSMPTTCTSCHQRTVTRLEKSFRSKAHLWAFLLCICGCVPCCLIPYCMDDCMSVNHFCSQCNAYLGNYESY